MVVQIIYRKRKLTKEMSKHFIEEETQMSPNI